MSFSASRVPTLKSQGFRERRFSTSKDPTESGKFTFYSLISRTFILTLSCSSLYYFPLFECYAAFAISLSSLLSYVDLRNWWPSRGLGDLETVLDSEGSGALDEMRGWVTWEVQMGLGNGIGMGRAGP